MANISLNPNDKTDNAQLSENNTKVVFTSVNGYVRVNKGMKKGKKYFEVHTDTNAEGLSIGIAKPTIALTYNTGYCFYYQGYTYPSGAGGAENNYQVGSRIIGVAVDMDSSPRTVSFYLDNVLVRTETIADDETELFPFINQYYYTPLPKSVSIKLTLDNFTYSLPQGYVAYGSSPKFIINTNAQYYTIKGNKMRLLENQTLSIDNFKTNGFQDLNLLTQSNTFYEENKQLQSNVCEFDLSSNIAKIEVI